MRQSSVKVLGDSASDTGTEESCVDLYFVEEDGSTFKSSYIFRPYILLHVKGNNTVYGEVEQFLLQKYEKNIAEVQQCLKDDLDMPNHLSGLKRVYMKLLFRNVDDLVLVRRDLLPMVEKNRVMHRKNEEAGLTGDSGIGVGSAAVRRAGAGGLNVEMESQLIGGIRQGASSNIRKKRDECMSNVVDIREYDVVSGNGSQRRHRS
jgi:DNA polymerase epsilon subunit 1